MPAIISHYLFSKACAEALSGSDVYTSVNQHSDIFYLGAQGPDILFFALGNKPMNQLGERMHHDGVNNFLAECINRIRKTASHEGRHEITAYTAGFICHYALDTCAHPYIYYKTGFSDEEGRLFGESLKRHYFMETTIDCILSKKLEDTNPYSINIAEKITVGSKKRALVGQFLSDMVKAGYGVFMYPEDYIKAMKDIAFVYRVFRDRTGKKKKAVKAVGKIFRGADAIAEMIHYSNVKPLDYLNEQRGIWHYPWDDSVDLYFSFMDLYNKAVEDSRIYINAFMKAVNKQLDDKIALSILGNKNFSTGLENTVKFLYYDIQMNKLLKE